MVGVVIESSVVVVVVMTKLSSSEMLLELLPYNEVVGWFVELEGGAPGLVPAINCNRNICGFRFFAKRNASCISSLDVN